MEDISTMSMNQDPTLIAGRRKEFRAALRLTLGLTLASVGLNACGGESDTSPRTVATNLETSAPTTEATPTTVEVTTTEAMVVTATSEAVEVTTTELTQAPITEAVMVETTAEPVADFSYQLEPLNCGGNECTAPIPEGFPVEARNPVNPGLSLAEIQELGASALLCVHTTEGALPAQTAEEVAALKAYSGSETFPAVLVTDDTGNIFNLDARLYGVSPYSDGVTWDASQYVTAGNC